MLSLCLSLIFVVNTQNVTITVTNVYAVYIITVSHLKEVLCYNNKYMYFIACLIVNHFSTTGHCSGLAHYDVSIRQAARAAFVTSSFKIFFYTNFSAMLSHVLYIAFEGDDSAIQWL